MRFSNICTLVPPFDTAEEWDNSGLLVGAPFDEVHAVVVALDATAGALAAAKSVGADLLITHHPVIFAPLQRLERDGMPYRLAAAGVSLLAAHTNLDKAAGGVNDTLAALLELSDVTVAPDGMSRIGHLAAPLEPADFARYAAERLQTAVRLGGTRSVRTVAVCGGSGGDFIDELAPLADAFVTGEIKHHQWLQADACGLTLLEAGHYATEVPVVDTLCDWLRQVFPAMPVTPYYEGAPYTTILK